MSNHNFKFIKVSQSYFPFLLLKEKGSNSFTKNVIRIEVVLHHT
nr:MAG TPA: hypothetical protein [Crassvirales sp.]